MSECFTGVEIRWRPVGGAAGGAAKFPVGAVVAIGRDTDNDIVLLDQEVSRKHARLVVQASDVTFTDLRSRNGSRIDGRRRLGATQWLPGQILQIGNHLLEVELVVEAPNAKAGVTPPSGDAHPQLLPRSPDERAHSPGAAWPATDTVAPLVKSAEVKSAPPDETPNKVVKVPKASDLPSHQPEGDPAMAEAGRIERVVQSSPPRGAEQREPSPEPASEIAAPSVAVTEATDQPADVMPKAETLQSAVQVLAGSLTQSTAKVAHRADAASDATPPIAPVLAASATADPPTALGLVANGQSPELPGLETGHVSIKPATEIDPAAEGGEPIAADRREPGAPATGQLDEPRHAPIGPKSTSAPEQDLVLDRVEQDRRHDGARSIRHRPLLALVGAICLLLLVGAAFYGLRASIQFIDFDKSAPSTDIRADARPPPTQEPQLRIDPGMHSAAIRRIAVDAACSLVATASHDKTVRLWRLPEGKLLNVLRPPIDAGVDGKIDAVAMAPDGSWVAAGGFNKSRDHWIYIFNTVTRAVMTRLGPFPSVINHLAVSADGRYLAAALHGVRVWERTGSGLAAWRFVAEDKDYHGASYGAAFGPGGILYTVAYDGKLRRYTPGYSSKPITVAAQGGNRPYSVSVNPAGDRVAVSFDDSRAVEIYDAATLARIFAADTSSIKNGSLFSVAWSGDGSRLYAGGTYGTKEGIKLIRVWERAGEGSSRDLRGGLNTILDSRACGDGLAVASADPAFGIIAADGSRRLWQEGVQADMRAKRFEHFTVSADGERVRFGLKERSGDPILFDLGRERVSDAPEAAPELYAAETKSLPVTDWINRPDPKLAGTPIQLNEYELARSLAVAPDKQRFVLGTEWSLRLYDVAAATKAPRAWLGVRWRNIDDAAVAKLGLTEARGALIVGVITPSPANKAGLKESDVLLGVNNEPVANVEELISKLSGFSPNDKIDLKIWRAKQELTVSVNLGAAPIAPTWRRLVPSVAWGVNITKDGKLVVAAYGDGTIRWHRLSDGQELLALFVHAKDRRWVAWTPKGYYTASAGGENLIGWHVNRGWTDAADFFPAQRFRNRFYRPDIVHKVLQTLDEDKAIAEADRLDNTARQERDILKLLPPVVEILSPKDGDHFVNPNLTIQYSARSTTGQKVDDIEVYLDDQKINTRGLTPVATTSNDAQSLAVSLPRRNVKITLVARSVDKSSEPRSIELRWSGAMADAKPQPRLLALLIGVSAYNQQSLKLNFAHQDALNLAEALKAQEGKAFLKVEANVLLNADSTSIRKGFDWLNTNARDGDLTLILLSGHGTTRNNTFYFLPADADPSNLSATAISGHEIVGTIQGLPGGKLLLIDSCRAGGGLTPVGMSQVPVDMNKLANDMGQPVGAIFFGSSTAGELSYEDSKLKAGVFTAAIVEGLRGRADLNGDGKIETDEMLVWLRKRVPELTEDRQHPLRHQSAPVEYTMSGR